SQASLDLGPRHPQNCAVQPYVLRGGELGVEPAAHLEQRAHAAAHHRPSFGGVGDPAEDLQEGALARAVVADDAEHLTGRDGEIDTTHRPGVSPGATRLVVIMLDPPEEPAGRVRQQIPQGQILFAFAQLVALAEVYDFDGGRVHISSANVSSMRRKTMRPTSSIAAAVTTEMATVPPDNGTPRNAHRKPSITPTIGLSAYAQRHCSGTRLAEYATAVTKIHNWPRNGTMYRTSRNLTLSAASIAPRPTAAAHATSTKSGTNSSPIVGAMP